MSKKRKKGKPIQQPLGGYKRFLKDLYTTLELLGIEEQYFALSHESKRRLHWCQVKIRNPESINQHASPKDLKRINETIRKFYKIPYIEIENATLSCQQLWMLHAYYIELARLEKKQNKESPLQREYAEKADCYFKEFYTRMTCSYYTALTELCNPAVKYLSIKSGFTEISKKDPRVEMYFHVHAISPVKKSIMIGGINRPAFRIGIPLWEGNVNWVSVKTSMLGSWYHGRAEEIEVYIQSHALFRLNERLDLMAPEYINYVLWDNTVEIKEFVIYHNYLLFPFKLYGIKVGYLAASIVEDKLLFRTFLFITHNCTPEGDKLKELSGLGKEDVKYWGIDRISAFMGLDEEKNPELVRIFTEAGISNIFKLKGMAFDQALIGTEDFEGLEGYIHKNLEMSKPDAEFLYENFEA